MKLLYGSAVFLAYCQVCVIVCKCQQCDDGYATVAYECFNKSFPASSNDEAHCEAYQSCSLASIDLNPSDSNSYLTTDGVAAALNAQSLTSFSSFLRGYASAALSTLETRYSVSYAGEYSGAGIAPGTFGAFNDCLGARSCVHSTFFSSDALVYTLTQIGADGAFSLFNSTWHSDNLLSATMTLSGYYAGFSASFNCAAGTQCTLNCNGNACYNFNFVCDDSVSNCDVSCDTNSPETCPNGWFGNIVNSSTDSLESMPDFYFLQTLENIINISYFRIIPQYTDIIINQDFRFSSTDIACEEECYDSFDCTTLSDELLDTLCCFGFQSCANINTPADTILCDALWGCSGADLVANKLFVGGHTGLQWGSISFVQFASCSASLACYDTNIIGGKMLFCDGEESCASSTITNVSYIFAFGSASLKNTNVTVLSNQNELNIFFLAYQSASNTLIDCQSNPQVELNIYCQNDGCASETAEFTEPNVQNCDNFVMHDTVSAESLSSLLQASEYFPTNEPTSVPTIEPTNVPTISNVPTSVSATASVSTEMNLSEERLASNTTEQLAIGSDVGNQNSEKKTMGFLDYSNWELGTQTFILCMFVMPLILIFLHNKTNVFYSKKVNSIKHTLDGVDKLALFKCFFSFTDFMTDVIFAFLLVLRMHYLGYYALLFALVPHIISSIYALHWVRTETKYRLYVRKYLDKYDSIVIGLSVLCGFYSAVALCQSRLFYANMLNLQMKNTGRDRLTRWRFYNTVILEDLPLFVIQILFVIDVGEMNAMVLMPMIFSVSSIFTSFVVVVSRKANVSSSESDDFHNLYRYNFKFELVSKSFQSAHKFSNNQLSEIFAKIFAVDEKYVEVYYIYAIRNGIACFVEISQKFNNAQLVETVLLCDSSNTGASPSMNLSEDICQHFGFSNNDLIIRVGYQQIGLEVNKVDSNSSTAARDAVHIVQQQQGKETPKWTQGQKMIQVVGLSREVSVDVRDKQGRNLADKEKEAAHDIGKALPKAPVVITVKRSPITGEKSGTAPSEIDEQEGKQTLTN